MEYKLALKLALDAINVQTKVENIKIDESLNRVLAENIYALRDLPPFDNSAMDGYGFRHKEINKELKVARIVLAGDSVDSILNEGECYKIMTGAKVPSDCDTIAPREICDRDNNTIRVNKAISLGNAIRKRGEELAKDNLLLKKGEVITPAKIALLASQGITDVNVFKNLNIAIISTGSELKELNEKANDDELYNINGINIKMHLKKFAIESNYIGALDDNLQKSIKLFKNLQEYDIIISSGGVSKGDADYTKQALLKNGFKELFHGLKVKPGHPVLMGTMQGSFIIALPGNPLAAIIQLLTLGLPIIFKARGMNSYFLNTIIAKMGKELTLKPNRVNIVLGNLVEGEFYPYKDNRYGSGMITPLVESNAIAIFNETSTTITKGSVINVILLNQFDITSHYNYIN